MQMRYQAVLAAALLGFAGCASAPDTNDPEEVASRYVDPRVETILRDVSALLGGSQQMSFRAEITYDEIEMLDEEATTDARVQYGARADFTVSRPGKLRVSFRGDRVQREFFLDGNVMTMLASDENTYASLNAPGTIDDALDVLWESAGVAPPLSDLVYRDPYARLRPKILSGSYVGLHDVDGHPCHHIFLSQETVDWQLWVDAGDTALPRRIVISYREIPQVPMFAAELGEWNFEPSLSPETFSFEPPANAIEIDAVATPVVGETFGEVR